MLVKKHLCILLIIILLQSVIAEELLPPPVEQLEGAGLNGALGINLQLASESRFPSSEESAGVVLTHFGFSINNGVDIGSLSGRIEASFPEGTFEAVLKLNNEVKGNLVLESLKEPKELVIQSFTLTDNIAVSSLSIVNENLLVKLPVLNIFIKEELVGQFYLGITLSSFLEFPESDVLSAGIAWSSQGATSNVGSIELDAKNIELQEIARAVTTFEGRIMSTAGEVINKGVLCVSSEANPEFCLLVNDGSYRVTLEGRDKDKIAFKFNGADAGTKLLDIKTPNVNSNLQIDVSSVNFADDDQDGMPNSVDTCPDSLVPDIDIKGCDCSQKKCSVDMQCQPNLFLGNKCVTKPVEFCEETDNCIKEKAPKFCHSKGIIVNHCQKCGCPEGFTCTESGSCAKVLTGLVGSLCKDNDFFYSLDNIECPKGWIKEDVKKYVSFTVKGSPIVKGKIKKKIRHRLNAVTLCLKATDMGCAPPDKPYKCRFEDLLEKNRGKAEQIIKDSIAGGIPSLGRINSVIGIFVTEVFGISAKIRVTPHVDLSQFSLREMYKCQPKLVFSDRECVKLVDNGPPDKRADLVFVGDGYLDDAEFFRDLLDMLDYNSDFAYSEKEGLFSIEPFKSHKTKFNIWAVNAKDGINHFPSPIRGASSGNLPDDKGVNDFSSACPEKDHVIVVSKQVYRSFCMFGGKGNCFVSVGDQRFKGRLLLHEFGHGFASLEDEYANEASELKNVPNRIEALVTDIRTDAANCQPDESRAGQKWGSLIAPENKIGYFKGCGGDCLPYCRGAVRPTFNSIMRHEEQTTGSPEDCKSNPLKCRFGPPFDPYYAVNEREILKELDKYEAGDSSQTVLNKVFIGT